MKAGHGLSLIMVIRAVGHSMRMQAKRLFEILKILKVLKVKISMYECMKIMTGC